MQETWFLSQDTILPWYNSHGSCYSGLKVESQLKKRELYPEKGTMSNTCVYSYDPRVQGIIFIICIPPMSQFAYLYAIICKPWNLLHTPWSFSCTSWCSSSSGWENTASVSVALNLVNLVWFRFISLLRPY